MKDKCIDVFMTLEKLHLFSKAHNYKGYDVADGIESPLITKTFLRKSAFFRLLFQQLTAHRFSYFNLRPFLFIPQRYNAKGIALFITGYCNLYKILDKIETENLNKEICKDTIRLLTDRLIALRSKGKDNWGWGYPMGWQGRMNFYWPANTPTVVASSFAVDALFNAYRVTNNSYYKEVALETANFVLKDLKRTTYKNGFFFSYSALDGMEGVYNASLLGARILIQCYEYNKNEDCRDIARKAIDTCANDQNNDGSWYYGIGDKQKWIDNFHTGYNLEAISEFKRITGEHIYDESLRRGLDFMLKNHFEENGVPKYFHNKQYPIDIHCCGELFPVLYKLGAFENNKKLADNVYRWTIRNMFNQNKGYFYFQKRKYHTIKVPLMRWSEAFMMNALSYYLLLNNNEG